jgi:hypothetical protein
MCQGSNQTLADPIHANFVVFEFEHSWKYLQENAFLSKCRTLVVGFKGQKNLQIKNQTTVFLGLHFLVYKTGRIACTSQRYYKDEW